MVEFVSVLTCPICGAFEQPHRGPQSETCFWDYSEFEGFTFDKEQYVEAIRALRGAA